MDDVFFLIMNGVENFKKIDNILDSYVNFLDSVKKTYVLQDINFGQQISHKN